MEKIRTLAPSTVKQYHKQKKLYGLVWIGTEGLELQKIIDRINEEYVEHGIVLNDVRYTLENCILFTNDAYNETCLIFPFLEEMPLDLNKLAMWRMALRQMGIGVVWVEDYIANRMR